MGLYPFLGTLCTLTLSLLAVGVDGQACNKINSCSCSYGEDQVVDLSPLQGNPKWSDQWDPSYINMFSYNPCTAFTEGTCNSVAVCQYNGADYYECGTQDSATFTNDPTSGALSVSYASTDSAGTTRTSTVLLTCDKGGQDVLTIGGEISPTFYDFELKSPHCCIKSGPGPSPSGGGGSSGGISPGTILLIAFLSITIVYFVAGVVFLKVRRQAQGLEAVPNRTFWGSIPGLVRDGVLFVVRRGDGSYNKI